MEQPREGAPGAPQWPRGPQGPLFVSKPHSTVRREEDGHQSYLQELRKPGHDDSSRLNAASLGAQSTWQTPSSFDSAGGAIPVSAASHALHASGDTYGAQPHPFKFVPQVIKSAQPLKGVPTTPNHGKQLAPAPPKQQKPSIAGLSHTQTGVAPVSAAQPQSVIPHEASEPQIPAANTHNSTSAPQALQHVAKTLSQNASSAEAFKSLPSLTTSVPALNGRVSSDTSRQHGSSGDDRGSTPGQSPADNGHPPVSKPILKMKRTGQNFPISSARSASPLRTPTSLHQKNASSPNRKTGSIPQSSSSSWKAPESPPKSRGPVFPATSNGPTTGQKIGSNPSVQFSTDSSRDSMYGSSTNGTIAKSHSPIGRPPKPAPTPIHGKTGGMHAESLPNGQPVEVVAHSTHDAEVASDDEIKYEIATKSVIPDDVLEGDVEDDSSDDDTGSGVDDDEAMGSTSSRGADESARQLFHPPEESDYGDETDDDGTVSSSSSSESSPAADAEPMVALPSANIQHEQDYPKQILEMANSGRPYLAWFDESISSEKCGGALFPDGYTRCTEIEGYPWICAVRSCRQVYKTHFGLGNHFKFTHKRSMFNDNMDGTLSVVGSYSKRSQAGNCTPIVVSRRPLDPNEPPMVEPTEPTRKGKFIPRISQTKAESETKDSESYDLVKGDVNAPILPSVPSEVTQAGNADEMWQYIRPFLRKHESVPVTNWVGHVIHLPRVRDIKWNEPRTRDRPYRDSHPRDVTALIVQLTGVEAPMPCTSCAQGKGPFDGCVMISAQASQESRDHVLACANCYYHSGQSFCSHCTDVVSRRDKRDRLTKRKTYNVKVLSDRARGAVKAPKTLEQRQASRMTAANQWEETLQLNMRVFPVSEIHPLEMASKDRAYKVIKGKDRELISMCGALIPEGYDLDRSVAGRPWVCPIRSCRNVFKKIAGLGSHFCTKHRGALLNDNQNGTLSIVGIYNQLPPGYNYFAPLIISKNPLDENEPPMPAARVPGYVRVDNTSVKPQSQSLKHTALAHPEPAKVRQLAAVKTPDVGTHSQAKRIWNYILPFLPPSMDPNIFDAELVRLFALPLLQSVQWRRTWMRRRLDNDYSQVFGMLVHVLGVGRNGGSGKKPCSLCARGEGPFEGCWILPRNAAWESHKYAMCCANCLFNHKRHECSVKSAWEGRCDSKPGEKVFLGAPPPVFEWAVSAAKAGAGSQNKKRRLSSSDDQEESLAHRQRTGRNQGVADEVDLPPLLSKKPPPATDRSRRRTPSPAQSIQHSTSFSSMPSSAIVMAGQPTSDELLEMEDWEIAPGRIREDGVDQLNNIAFSKSYLENNQMVPVSADVSFRVDTIKSGHKLEFEATSSKARYCSVASGKLHVSIAGQPKFVIGPHGVFKIKPGVKAWAQNRLYIDSVLHVISVDDGA